MTYFAARRLSWWLRTGRGEEKKGESEVRKITVLVLVGIVAAFVGMGCQTTKSCKGSCKKEATAQSCATCPKKDTCPSKGECKSDAAKCAKCGCEKSACKCAADAAKK